MANIIHNIEFYAGPKQRGAPDNLENVIIGFIDKTESKLEVAIQILENKKIARAIIRARRDRGVLVKVILEQSYVRERASRKRPWNQGGWFEKNREILSALLRSDIDVKLDFNVDTFHQKFMTRDGNAVLTGSANFTSTGTRANLNNVIIINDKKVTDIYEKEFRRMQQGQFDTVDTSTDDMPPDVIVSSIPIRVRFSPHQNPEAEIVQLINSAKERIDFSIYTFSESSGIDEALIGAKNAGINVKGAFDQSQGEHSWAAIPQLMAAGIELYAIHKNGVRKLHHQILVIDRQVTITGSFNFTGPANNQNNENIIVLGSLDNASESRMTNQNQLGLNVIEELDRIIEVHGEQISGFRE
jgi:phosphatidylserine/phosphatidylglycerophosphate/cardiolipin synthase-like enzyme